MFGHLISDHRGVWVDIPKFLLYGYNPPQPQFFHARRLKITDPRVVEKYLTYLHCAMKDHDLFRQMDEIHKDTRCPLTTRIIDRYEEIDLIVGRLMDEAEKQCRKYILDQLLGLRCTNTHVSTWNPGSSAALISKKNTAMFGNL